MVFSSAPNFSASAIILASLPCTVSAVIPTRPCLMPPSKSCNSLNCLPKPCLAASFLILGSKLDMKFLLCITFSKDVANKSPALLMALLNSIVDASISFSFSAFALAKSASLCASKPASLPNILSWSLTFVWALPDLRAS